VTDEETQAEERLRRALHRYTGRFEPLQPEWARIEARHVGATRRSSPRRRLLAVSIPALAAACVLLVVGVLARPARVHVDVAQAEFVEPHVPQYAAVVPQPAFAPDTTMAAIQARGFIRVGVKVDQPYFGLKDPKTGDVAGFDVEIAKLIAVGIFGGSPNDLGKRVQPVPVMSRNREASIQEGTVDIVIATYSITGDREQKVDFAGPYFLARQDIMVKANDSSIKGVDDLSGRKVCTAQGSTSYQNLVNRNSRAIPVLRDTYSECAKALSDGGVDAVTTDQPILAGYEHQSGGTFKVLNNPFSDEKYGIGLPKGDDAFRSFLDERLRHIEDNGDWTRAARYSLSNIETLPPPLGR
jgi:glutamate transport system substrate-binding protein